MNYIIIEIPDWFLYTILALEDIVKAGSGWKYDNIEGYITIDEFGTLFKVNTTPNGFIVEVDSEKIIRSYDEDLNLIPD